MDYLFQRKFTVPFGFRSGNRRFIDTFFTNFFNNRFQAQERDKDRVDQRREAKTQLALELMRSDIKITEDSIDNALKVSDIDKLSVLIF